MEVINIFLASLTFTEINHKKNLLLWRSQDVNQTLAGLVDFCWDHKYSYLCSYLDFCSLGELPLSSVSTDRDHSARVRMKNGKKEFVLYLKTSCNITSSQCKPMSVLNNAKETTQSWKMINIVSFWSGNCIFLIFPAYYITKWLCQNIMIYKTLLEWHFT